MAFVFKSERPCLGVIKSPFPGPGTYTSDEKPPIDVNSVPFLSSAQRSTGPKPDKTPVPGPGTYIAPVSVQGYNNKTKTLYSALNPEMPALLEHKSSSNFTSGTIRFPKQKEAEAPGPGTYDLPPAAMTVKGMSQSGYSMGASVNRNKDKYNREIPGKSNIGVLKAAVPSIPSVIHSYGYTEAETKELTLNNNPLLEIQKFVGPGYYDVPTANDYNRPKGISWKNSKVERGFNPELAVSTASLGPGAYKPKAKVYLPLYKFKPSAAFSSNCTRSISDKERARAERKKKQALKKADTNLMENPNPELDSEMDGMTPGPGYYHNHSAASSFKQTFKAPQHQFFGSGGERFDNSLGAKTTVGPGRYNIRKDFGKKVENDSDVKVPFSTNVQRFVDNKNDVPGPGTYVGQGGKLAANENNIERFGVTETRFKHDFEGTPGPGTYYDAKGQVKNKDEKGSKTTSHMFTSTSKREAIKVDNIDGPAPGAYNVGYHDVATKVKKLEEEDMELSLKRVPFSSNVERFKSNVAHIEERHDDGDDEDDSFDEGWNVDGPDRGDLILKARKQPKISSSFASKTQRKGLVTNPKEKAVVPGPGKYNAGGPDDWIKKTYNVNFTAD